MRTLWRWHVSPLSHRRWNNSSRRYTDDMKRGGTQSTRTTQFANTSFSMIYIVVRSSLTTCVYFWSLSFNSGATILQDALEVWNDMGTSIFVVLSTIYCHTSLRVHVSDCIVCHYGDPWYRHITLNSAKSNSAATSTNDKFKWTPTEHQLSIMSTSAQRQLSINSTSTHHQLIRSTSGRHQLTHHEIINSSDITNSTRLNSTHKSFRIVQCLAIIWDHNII